MTTRTTAAFLVGIALLSAACIVPVRETSRRTVRRERSNVEVVRSGVCRADLIDVVEETTWILDADDGDSCVAAPAARAETTVTRVRKGQTTYPCIMATHGHAAR